MSAIEQSQRNTDETLGMVEEIIRILETYPRGELKLDRVESLLGDISDVRAMVEIIETTVPAGFSFSDRWRQQLNKLKELETKLNDFFLTLAINAE